MTRILFCVREAVLAKEFEHLLRQVEGFELLPTCRSVAELMTAISQSARPDLVLLDLTPDVTFAAISELKRATAESKIVLWVNSASTELAFQAMGLGVRGILRKQLPVAAQVKCVQKVLDGEIWFEKAWADGLGSSRRVIFSEREAAVVSLLAQGLKDKEIAAKLKISEGAVKVYLSQLFEKAAVRDRFELALYGVKNLITKPPQEEEGQLDRSGFFRGLRSFVSRRPESVGASIESRLPPAAGRVRPEVT